MEKRDLYDKNKIKTGKIMFADEPIPEGYYILIVLSFIENLEGKYLIQKRSEIKGGEWAFTGGHPKAGESSYEGIKAEIKEELGLELDDLTLFKTIDSNNLICDLYYNKQDVDLNDIVMQEEEVSDVMYASEEEIHNLYKEGKFKKSHYMMFQDCLKYKEDQKN